MRANIFYELRGADFLGALGNFGQDEYNDAPLHRSLIRAGAFTWASENDLGHCGLFSVGVRFQIAVMKIRETIKRESFAMDGHEEIIMANKLRFTLPFLAAFILMGLFTASAQAKVKSDYLGEFCWLFETDESLTLFRLGITSEGDGHHSVNGHVTERQPGEEWESSGPITGNMEIIGDERIMTLHSSDIDGFPPEESLLVSSMFHLRLDGATLDGNVYGIIDFYNLTYEHFSPKEAGGPIEIQYLPDCIVP